MVQVNKDFLEKILWEEYLEYAQLLESLVEEITDDVINKIHQPEAEDMIQGNYLK